jgi:ketol-acid reductoisomerase
MGKFIVSGDGLTIINMDKVKNIFFGTEKRAVMALIENAASIPLLSVDTSKEGKMAIQIVAERMKRDDVVFMPTPDEIQAKIKQDSTKYTHLHGEKTKGHGGS